MGDRRWVWERRGWGMGRWARWSEEVMWGVLDWKECHSRYYIWMRRKKHVHLKKKIIARGLLKVADTKSPVSPARYLIMYLIGQRFRLLRVQLPVSSCTYYIIVALPHPTAKS